VSYREMPEVPVEVMVLAEDFPDVLQEFDLKAVFAEVDA